MGELPEKSIGYFYLFNLITAFFLSVISVILNPDISSEELDNLGSIYRTDLRYQDLAISRLSISLMKQKSICALALSSVLGEVCQQVTLSFYAVALVTII